MKVEYQYPIGHKINYSSYCPETGKTTEEILEIKEIRIMSGEYYDKGKYTNIARYICLNLNTGQLEEFDDIDKTNRPYQGDFLPYQKDNNLQNLFLKLKNYYDQNNHITTMHFTIKEQDLLNTIYHKKEEDLSNIEKDIWKYIHLINQRENKSNDSMENIER